MSATPRCVRIEGGPAPVDVRIIDSDTGADLTGLFLSFDLCADGRTMQKVMLTAYAALDVEAEVELDE